MLVNLNKVLEKNKNKAVIAVNVYNSETVEAVGIAAKNLKKPIIFSYGEAYEEVMPMDLIGTLVRYLGENTDLNFVLHLDHAKKKETVLKAIDCGFTSVMFDGSHLALDENIEKTQEVAALVHRYQMSIEGELGYMNPEDGSLIGECKEYTRPEDAQRFVEETGVDALAIAIGNAHGIYKGNPHLAFDVLSEINERISVPLVLHGSSGIPFDQIKKAVSLGISKINVNTEIALGAVECIRKTLLKNQNDYRYEKLIKETKKELVSLVEKYMAF